MAILPWRKVNYATKMWVGKCDVPFWVYVETAFPTLLRMLLRFGALGQSELLKAKFGKTPQRWSRRLFKNMQAHNPKYNFKGKKFLWKFIGRFSLVGQIFLILDILMDGYFRWTSLIHNAAGCTPTPGLGTLQRSNPFETVKIANTGWGAVFCPVIEQNSDNWLDSAADVNLPPGNYLAVFGASFQLHPDDPADIVEMKVSLALQDVGFFERWESEASLVGPDLQDFLVQAEFTVPIGQIYRLTWSQHGDHNAELLQQQADILVSSIGGIETIGG